MGRRRLGVIVNNWEFRSDLGGLIQTLAQHFEIVFFAVPREAALIDSDHHIRSISSRIASLPNRLWNAAYILFGNRPRSFRNHYDWKKLRLEESGQLWGWSHALLEASRFTPSLIDFDSYIAKLSFRDSPKIDDIDFFLNFTDANDVHFLAHIVAEGRPIFTYLYSWDHPGKFYKFSRTTARYLTWNDELKRDLVDLHGILPEHVTPVGSTQLSPVFEYLNGSRARRPRFEFPYILYGASAGSPTAVLEEARVIRLVAQSLAAVAPDYRLVVRPYPRARNRSPYEALSNVPNIVIDHEGAYGQIQNDAVDKYNSIVGAACFVHLGTTLGMEAAYLDTPTILLDLKTLDFTAEEDVPILRRYHKSYHLDKYLRLPDYPNVVGRLSDLDDTIRKAVVDPNSMMAYNRKVSEWTALRSIGDVANTVAAAIDSHQLDRGKVV